MVVVPFDSRSITSHRATLFDCFAPRVASPSLIWRIIRTAAARDGLNVGQHPDGIGRMPGPLVLSATAARTI
jgi:hypothetical protein